MAEQISSSDKPITLADWHIIYQRLLPYLGGNKAVDGNPIGTVIAFPISTPPAGYLVCDGSKLSVTAFPLLFDVLKNAPASQRATWGDADWVTEFNVPDYRGEFPRFYGTNSHTNQGNGGEVGEHQDGTEIPNFFVFNNGGTYKHGAYLSKQSLNSGEVVYVKKQDAVVNTRKSLVWDDATLLAGEADNVATFTSRPTNTSFLPCIKYTYVTQEVEYSTTEHVVGTWIDGKPLYEKTIETTLPNVETDKTSVTKEVSTGLDSWGICYICEAFISSSSTNGNSQIIPYVTTDGYNISVFLRASTHSLAIDNNRYSFNGRTVYVTIQYTKTS